MSTRTPCSVAALALLPLAAVGVLLAAAGCRRDAAKPPASAPGDWGTVTFPEQGISARVELAFTPAKRQRGLMFRTELPENTGMLFLFPRDEYQGFWMKNCFMPLSIAYIRADGTISQILEMAPARTEPNPPTYDSRERVRYALEMEKGWFARHGIREGARSRFSEEIRRVRPQ